MRALLIPTVALAMSVSSVALAQGQQSGGQSPQQAGSQSSQQVSTRSYQEVEDALKQAGIQDVRTLNAAYLVSAISKNGEQVTLMVDPPISTGSPASGGSGQQSSASGQQSGNQQSGASGQQMALQSQQEVRDALTKAGFTNVQILDATYLATGKTQNGDEITMMIDPTASTGATGSGGSSGSGSSGQPQGGQSGSSSQ